MINPMKTQRKHIKLAANTENNSCSINTQHSSIDKIKTASILTPKNHLNNHPSTLLDSLSKYHHLTSEKKYSIKNESLQEKRTSEKKITVEQNQGKGRKIEDLERQEHNCQNYFLRKTIMLLYNFFQKQQLCWDLHHLSYGQFLMILKQLKYIKYADEDLFAHSAISVSQQLKKCYWIWINVSQNKRMSMVNLIIILCCVENLGYDSHLIEDIVQQLEKGIEKFGKNGVESEPKYIFLAKKQAFQFQNGYLILKELQIQKIRQYLKSFNYTKWMQINPKNCKEEIQQAPLPMQLSKKSEELALSKRKKIFQEIKIQQPQIHNIELHHLLSYKENYCKNKPLKTQSFEPYQLQKNKPNCKQKYTVSKFFSQKSEKISRKKSNNQCKKLKNANFNEEKVKQKLLPFTKNDRKVENKQVLQRLSSNHSLQKDNTQSDILSCKLSTKQQIIDDLEWQEIPKQLEEISFQRQLFDFKDEFKIDLPLSKMEKSQEEQIRQKNRREYLDLPILYVDVNIQQGHKERIIIYDGDKAKNLAIQFGKKHGLNKDMIGRLQLMLQQQISSVLTKIEEAVEEDCSYLD